MYNPHSTRYKYPDFTDQHYLVVKKNNGAVFDENYHILIILEPLDLKNGGYVYYLT